MAEKKVVDDYYSNINSSGDEGKKSAGAKKPVVKAKKIIIKKAAPKKDVAVKVDSKTSGGAEKKSITVKPKKMVQTIKVVKRDELISKRERPQSSGGTGGKTSDAPRVRPTVVLRDKIKDRPAPTRTKHYGANAAPVGSRPGDKKYDEKKPRTGFLHTRTRGKVSLRDDNQFTRSNKVNKKKKEEKKIEDIVQNLTERTGETVILPDVLSLKEFSEKIGVVLPKLMAEFMKNGMMVNINSKIDFDSASIVAEAFDIKIGQDDTVGVHIDDVMAGDLTKLLGEEDPDKLVSRAPVISIMGHVDHGKTSLLDHIRKAKVTAGEAGGITQSIGAYQVELDDKKITFLDTPGHEAFTIMRARGAKSTDIAILVVAADEGVKPQTIESINHAKEADIPVIVAINKMDKEGANPDHVKGQLSEHGLTPEDWGGDTPMVPVSAMTGFGIDDLLEIILLVAEMKELKANPERNGIATIIESHLDHKLGPVATALVNTGHIDAGDHIVCEDASGKVKILKDYTGHSAKKANPGDPVLIVGLDKVVQGGNILQVVQSAEVAREKSNEYRVFLESKKREQLSSLDILMSKIKAGSLKQLKVIVKADTNGSLEAIKGALVKLSTEETTVSVIHSGVGSITEGDILMSEGSSAILIGFNVTVLPTATRVLDDSGIEYISSKIIYHITERVEKIVTGMLDPKEVETVLCKAKVGGIFFTSKKFMILGLILSEEESTIQPNTKIRVFRKDKFIGSGKIESLKKGVEEVKMLEGPTECGIKFVGDVSPEDGDYLEVYKIEIQK